jgi:hypothetical protein
MSAHLFDLDAEHVVTTNDDCYTPRWVFDALDLKFDMDVAAPVDPVMRTCPAETFLTPVEDGLTTPWRGVVWCNPPFSDFGPWARKWAEHDRGALMGIMAPRPQERALVMASADAVTFINPKFVRPGREPLDLWQAVFVAFRGLGTGPAERLAAADKFGGVLYGHSQDTRR